MLGCIVFIAAGPLILAAPLVKESIDGFVQLGTRFLRVPLRTLIGLVLLGVEIGTRGL